MRRWKLGTDCGHRQLVFPRSSVGLAVTALKGSAVPSPSCRMGIRLKAAMTNSDAAAPGRPHPPVMDALGKLCTEGKQLADYLWQVPNDDPALDQLCIHPIRALAMDALQRADAGHPGTPMELAPLAYVLWQRHLRYNPASPDWFGRDRFVLSVGDACMLLCSVLYLTGYELSL